MSKPVTSTKPMLPEAPKSPVRFSIRGVTDTIPNLKALTDTLEVDDGLKTYLRAELDKISSNAAKIDLHEVERPDGGLNLHLTIAAVHLGVKPDSIARPNAVDSPASIK